MGPSINQDGQISTWSKYNHAIRGWFQSSPKNVKYQVHLIDDIEGNGYCFTDGVGKMGLGLAKEVATRIGINVGKPVKKNISVNL